MLKMTTMMHELNKEAGWTNTLGQFSLPCSFSAITVDYTGREYNKTRMNPMLRC